ncbi:MAG: succinate dehydrogenase assembly factor 2 [Alphaproteobacteria bacterium]|nr:succinate dehydrogenase assembly factor 2 [Alphaproteobacteria bacterium]
MNKALTTDESRLKRLQFRSWHRGWKETDLILGQFADARLSTLSPAQLAAYDTLLDRDDDQIWGWITGKEAPPVELSEIVAMLEGYGRQV